MSGAQLAERIEIYLGLYEVDVVFLRREISGRMSKWEPVRPGASLPGVHYARRELQRLLDLAQRRGINVEGQAPDLDRVRRLDSEREGLLRQLGPAEVRRGMLAELAWCVADYVNRLEIMLAEWQEHAPEEYERVFRDDDIYNMETLETRTRIELQLEELGAGGDVVASRARLAEGDDILRRHGPDLYGPAIRDGSLRHFREAGFEPQERWWYFLDEAGGDCCVGSG